MWKFGRYNLLEKISERMQTLVFRGTSIKEKPVIIKVLNETYPSPVKLAEFKWEYELTHTHNSPHIVKSIELIQDKQGVALIEDDSGAVSLEQILKNRRLSLEECLIYGIDICKAFHDVHLLGIVHKDINPSNIVVNESTGELKIIDFSIAIAQPSEIPLIKNPSKIEGTLPYVSPEQTGRMNRLVDYRSDFYSLGVTLYEMLTGKLPFPYDDPLEIIHAHIAKQPLTPSEVDEDIPKPISDIVMRLLAKSADARYQSSWGIQADLERCLAQLQRSGEITPFALAQDDISDSLIIPQKLYGRVNELKILLDSFDEVSKGKTILMLIRGYSGIGKTALVQEVYKPMTANNAFFISGKFDQYLCNIPFSALRSAFKVLVRYLLGFSEEIVAAWAEKITEKFGPNLPLLLEIIPEVRLIVGYKNDHVAAEIDNATERQRLVTQCLIEFVKLFAQKEHPLIIFLDDLQWVDLATLDFFTKLLRDDEVKHLFLINAFRSNEVDSTHPLAKTVESLSKDSVPIKNIVLNNLEEHSVVSLVSDTLHREISESLELAKLIIDKTGGNPFFIIQFLKTIDQENLITFDVKKKEWQWEIENIKKLGISDNVIELMIGRLSKFSQEVQTVLSIAACIGNTFDLETLSKLCKTPLATVYQTLLPVIQAGYVFSLSEHELTEGDPLESSIVVQDFKFRHDKVQQAACALVDEKVRLDFHFAIGYYLFEHLSEAELDERLFEIVDHLNLAKQLILTENHDYWIDLNYQAALKAKRSSAYSAALKYLTNCMENMPTDCWETNYDQTLDFYKKRIELEFLNSNLDTSITFFQEALKHAKTNRDQSELHITPVTQLIFTGHYLDSIELARSALTLVGIELPLPPRIQDAISQEESFINKTLKDKDYSALLSLPPMTNQNILIAMTLLNKIMSACLFASETNLRIFVQLKMVSLSLQYGDSINLPRALSGYSWVLNKIYTDRFQEAFEICKLALRQCDRIQDPYQKSSVLAAQTNYCMPWIKHLKETFPLLDEEYVLGISSGNFEYACYGIAIKAMFLFCNGYETLETVFTEAQKAQHVAIKYRLAIMVATTTGLMLVVNNLRGNAQDRFKFHIDSEINEQKIFTDYGEEKLSYAVIWLNVLKSQMFYIYGDLKEALVCSDKAEKMVGAFKPMVCVSFQAAFRCLILMRLIPTADKTTLQQYQNEIGDNLKKLEIWTNNNPDGFQALFKLVCAEKARLEKNHFEAINLYYDAIQTAIDTEFMQYAALANELLGQFWLEQDKPDIAATFIQKASNLYQNWGAKAKIQLMHTEQYPSLLSKAIQERTGRVQTTTFSRGAADALNIDLSSILKASQTISTEINLTKLIQKVLMLSAQNIGAQRGVLLLTEMNTLMVQGEYNAVSDEFKDINNPYLSENSTELPHSLIRYVKKSHETIVLVNATEDNQFCNDPYIITRKPKSLLCSPLLRYNELIGILYFENNLVHGAFSPERLEILNILSTPVAISVENAKLYTAFESFVPHEFLAQLEKKSIFNVKPGDQVQKDMTILFCDIRNFTALSEKLSPKETYSVLNQYLALVNPIIKAHGGFVDKFLGDGIMALFPASSDAALYAAINIQKAIREANKSMQVFEGHQLTVGIGIHYGQLILGTVGNKDRMEGTVISDAVNVTSRIEGLTRFYDSSIIVTDAFLNHLKSREAFHSRFLGKVRVKGRLAQIMVYEILDGYSLALLGKKLQVADAFAEALDLYYQKKFIDAKEIFVKILEAFPEDHPSEVYLNRIEHHLSSGVKVDWDGIDDILEK